MGLLHLPKEMYQTLPYNK